MSCDDAEIPSQLLPLESHCRCPTTSSDFCHLYIRNGSYMSFHWSTCCFFWQMISRTHLLSVSTGLESYSTFLCSWLKYIISVLIAQVSFCDHSLLLEWSWCCTLVRYTYCLCMWSLWRNFTLSLEWRIDLQTSAKEGKTGAPQGNEHQLLFVSIPDTGGWLVVGSWICFTKKRGHMIYTHAWMHLIEGASIHSLLYGAHRMRDKFQSFEGALNYTRRKRQRL